MAGFGIRLVRSAGMEGFTGNTFHFPVNPANTGPIFTGDPVRFDAAGFIVEASGGADNNDFDILGTFMGCQYVDANGGVVFSPVWPGGAGATEIMAYVAMAPHSLYIIKGEAGATYTRANTVGKRFGVSYAPGRLMYGESGVTLGAVTAATGPLIVQGLARFPDNTWDSEEPIFEVSIMRPQGSAT